MKTSTSEFLTVRGLRSHIRIWGREDAPCLFMLHGWLDMSATFQFVVDALQHEWRVIAPDWRGFGQSEWQNSPYWYPEYLADLDVILRHYSPDDAVRLVGHSLGGNVACIYAAARPQRVSHLISLDAFGLADTPPEVSPDRMLHWLDQIADLPLPRAYASVAQLAGRLRAVNPRLTGAQADFLAQHFVQRSDEGNWKIAADPFHRVHGPMPYRLDEAMACWRTIRAKTLWLSAPEGDIFKRFVGDDTELERRLACFARGRHEAVANAGHNLQHDQPQVVAEAIERFLLEAE